MSFKKDFFSMMSIRLVLAILGFAIVTISARILTLEDFGSITLVVTVMSILVRLLSVGLGQAAQFYGAKDILRGSDYKIIIRKLLLVLIVLSFIVITLLDNYIKINLLTRDAYGIYDSFKYFTPLILLHFVISLYFLGKRDLKKYAVLSLIPIIATLICFSLYSTLDSKLDVVMLAWYVQFSVGAVLGIFYFYRKRSIESKNIREVVKYCYQSYMVSTLNFISQKISIVLIASSLTPSSIALFYAGKSISEVTTVIYGALGPLILSYTSEDESGHKSKDLFERVSRITLVLFSTIALIIALFAPILIPFIFGDKYSQSADILVILLPGVIFLTQQRLIENYLYGIKKQVNIVYIHILSIVLLTFGIPFLSSLFGLSGAVMAITLTTLTTLLTTMLLLYITTRIKPTSYLFATKNDYHLIILIFKKYLSRCIN